MRGSLSGSQSLKYNDDDAYSIAEGERVGADQYQPIMVAKVKGLYSRRRVKYYNVRTRSTVNMTPAVKMSMSAMGGACAIYAAIVNDKTSTIYNNCIAACPNEMTLRQFIMPLLINGLRNKVAQIELAPLLTITNPWVYDGQQSITLPANILDKFASVLSNS